MTLSDIKPGVKFRVNNPSHDEHGSEFQIVGPADQKPGMNDRNEVILSKYPSHWMVLEIGSEKPPAKWSKESLCWTDLEVLP